MKKNYCFLSEQLISEHIPQVNSIAHKIAKTLPFTVDVRDLISAGKIGLLNAIHNYKPSTGNKLRTYAEFKIKGAILDELRSQDWAPRRIRRQANVAKDQSNIIGIVSLNEIEKSVETESKYLADDIDIQAEVELKESLQSIYANIHKLTQKEKTVITKHYFHGLTFKEIGKAMGLVESRISQIHSQSISKLRKFISKVL